MSCVVFKCKSFRSEEKNLVESSMSFSHLRVKIEGVYLTQYRQYMNILQCNFVKYQASDQGVHLK